MLPLEFQARINTNRICKRKTGPVLIYFQKKGYILGLGNGNGPNFELGRVRVFELGMGPGHIGNRSGSNWEFESKKEKKRCSVIGYRDSLLRLCIFDIETLQVYE